MWISYEFGCVEKCVLECVSQTFLFLRIFEYVKQTSPKKPPQNDDYVLNDN